MKTRWHWWVVALGVGAMSCTVEESGSGSEASSGNGSSAATDDPPVASGDGPSGGSASTTATTSSSADGTTGDDPSMTSPPMESSGEQGTETGTPVGCFDYDAFEPFAVSYRDDVMPIFASRCSGCHSDPGESVYFGMGGTSEGEAVAIHDLLLDGIPKQAPHLSFVVPGDPLRSYMMAKMEYDDPGGTCSEVACMEPGCELQAPPSAQLPEPELAIMRSWIMGGALDD